MYYYPHPLPPFIPANDLLLLGTIVEHPGHGRGRIVGYNTSRGPFYGYDRYPYEIDFEDGYSDVYARSDFKVVED